MQRQGLENLGCLTPVSEFFFLTSEIPFAPMNSLVVSPEMLSRIQITYRENIFARIEAIVCVWILILSIAAPKAAMAEFVPELWRPVFPFQGLQLTVAFLNGALLFWRLSLMACLLWPTRWVPLLFAFATSFFCFGLCNCFWLEVQLFAPVLVTLFLLLAFALLGRVGKTDFSREAAFSVKFALVLLFFSAGLAKLRFSGFDWALSDSIYEYMRALLPANRDVLGSPEIGNLREVLLGQRRLLMSAFALSHICELSVPLALFSRGFSRFFGCFFLIFVLMNLLLFGINFISVLPLLVIWLIWDVGVQDLELRLRKPSVAVFATVAVLQLSVTSLAEKNWWPIMINDMYAKPYPFPRFEDLQLRVTDAIGTEKPIAGNIDPLLKMHVFIALFRMRDEELRSAFLAKVFARYKTHVCKDACDHLTGLKAVVVTTQGSEPLAQTE